MYSRQAQPVVQGVGYSGVRLSNRRAAQIWGTGNGWGSLISLLGDAHCPQCRLLTPQQGESPRVGRGVAQVGLGGTAWESPRGPIPKGELMPVPGCGLARICPAQLLP